MEALIRLQNDIFDRIEKAKRNYKKSPKERLSEQYVQTRLSNLEKLFSEFCNNHANIIQSSNGKELNASSYVKDDIYDTVEQMYVDFKSELMLYLSKSQNVCSNGSNESNPSCKSTQLKLPKITIPMFSGKYNEWTTFKDLFVSLIHDNNSVSNVQKLHYLKSSLTGEAEQLLRHIPITESDYFRCWELLQSRYSNKKFLSNNILKRFMSQRNIVTESASMLRDLIDTANDCLSALVNIGVDISTWDILIIYILTSKLDPETRKQWELNISSVNSYDDLPTYAQFKDFITNRYRALEFLEPGSVKALYNKKNVITPVSFHKPKVFYTSQSVVCLYCNETHRMYQCKKFANLDVDSRRGFVNENKICYLCLGKNHSAKFCRIRVLCNICRRAHHTLLHPVGNNTEGKSDISDKVRKLDESIIHDETKPSSSLDSSNKVASYFSNQPFSNQVLLATALVRAETDQGDKRVIRALLDQGSQASFVTEATVQYLGIRKFPVSGIISGLERNKSITVKSMVKIKLSSRFDSNITFIVQAYVLKSITTFLPTKGISTVNWIDLGDLNLADPDYHTPNKIDILLGAEVYSQVLQNGVKKGPSGSPIAQATSLGWILSGRVCNSSQHDSKAIVLHTHIEENELLKRFWEMEAEPNPIKRFLTDEEIYCEKFFAETTIRDAEGRYIVRLPFKKECNINLESRLIAEKRLNSLHRKLKTNENLKERYTDVINEYLAMGHMERVPFSEISNKCIYLPHHSVIREDKDTTKIRVVFDASCKYQTGESLNDYLLVGPSLQPDLRHLLMRWRNHPICLSADIIKMYRQVRVAKCDVEFQRLLWKKNIENTAEDYRLLRVTFGTASAPYLAVKALQQLAIDDGKDCPEIAERVMNDFYMDDLLTGCQSVEKGLKLYEEMNKLLKKGGFELQKWMTNSEDLLKEIKKINSDNDVDKELPLKMDEIVKLLGLTWNRKTDNFQYTISLPLESGPITKRKILSDISKLFDPLGWVAPTVITAKIIMQKLWIAGTNWDDEVPKPLLDQWYAYRKDLPELSKFIVPRWLHTEDGDALELHGFCDASEFAYAAVVYLRVIKNDGTVHVSLISAKTKVAPIKQVSIPRLELCGAVLLVRLIREIGEVMKIDKLKMHTWTDSSVVLAWINDHPRRWKTFVANRVSEIITTLEANHWHHISSSQNPADCASRGINPSDLVNYNLWHNGPDFLFCNIIPYPKSGIKETQMEEKIVHFTMTDDSILSRYSSLTKLVRVIAFCRRFLNIRKSILVKPFNKNLSIEELNDSLNVCIKICQREYFKEEIDLLQNKGANSRLKGRLRSLNPFIDSNGLLRVGGRLDHSQLDENHKHPILMPKKSILTDLLVNEAHKNTLHGGQQLMMTYLSSKYYIFGIKSVIRHYINRCVKCIRYKNNISDQLMGQLPSARVRPTRPFKSSGVDYAGPINIRMSKGRGYHSSKGYICLFVCMVTRAIHVEAVTDMTTQGFLAAFKRFVGRRGTCSNLWSDNATNFVGASRELHNMFNAEKSSMVNEIREILATNGTSWHFIPPYSPHFGGLWEAGVKSVKYHLKRVIGETPLTYEELTTVLIQIEACLNSRPLSRIDSESDSIEVLTPGHFLIGEPLVTVPDNNFEFSNISSLRRWQYTQKIMQSFWRRWSQEYLTKFLHRYKWAYQNSEPNINDVVLIKDNDLPPSRWLLGRVIAKHPGTDNITRVVTLQTKNSTIKRPTSKLCILPLDQ